jgi:hypothetical protein
MAIASWGEGYAGRNHVKKKHVCYLRPACAFHSLQLFWVGLKDCPSECRGLYLKSAHTFMQKDAGPVSAPGCSGCLLNDPQKT